MIYSSAPAVTVSPRIGGRQIGALALAGAQRVVNVASVARRLLQVPVVVVLSACFMALVEVDHPTKLRLFVAALVAGVLVALALLARNHGVLAVFAFLPVLAFSRRMLLPLTPWISADPMILIGPVVLLVLLVQRRDRVTDRQSRMSLVVGALVVWTALEVLNPRDGGLRSGLAGFLFTGLPLLWYFVGRDLVDRGLAALLLASTMVFGAIIALYGLLQSTGRFVSFDKTWATTQGYTALVVGHSIRAFGTFSSSAEYVTYLAIAIVVACAFAMYGHFLPLAIVPMLAVAIFLDGTRGIVVLLVLAVTLLVGLRTRRAVVGLIVAFALAGGTAAAIHSYAGTLQTKASQSNNVFVQHQVTGITAPLNKNKSTLPKHWSLFIDGLKQGFTTPLGSGPAATNRAGQAYGSVVAPSEVDLSNAFVDGGLVGGLLYLAVMVMVLRRAWWLYRGTGDGVVLAAIALLLVTLGNWTNGGFYAVTALVWLMIGWLERQWILSNAPAEPLPDAA